jgi:hypothetical protein
MTKTLLPFVTILGLSLVCGQVPMLTPMSAAQSVIVADESGIQHPPVPRLAPSLPAQVPSTRQSEGSSFVADAQGADETETTLQVPVGGLSRRRRNRYGSL